MLFCKFQQELSVTLKVVRLATFMSPIREQTLNIMAIGLIFAITVLHKKKILIFDDHDVTFICNFSFNFERKLTKEIF